MLLLDCSKGYNYLSWDWVERCLQATELPDGIQRLVLAMLGGEVRLVTPGVERGGLRFRAGLP